MTLSTVYCKLQSMFFDSDKSRQYLLLALKIVIIVVTFSYIYEKLTQDTSLAFKDFISGISFDRRSVLFLILFIFLTAANWFFEILKWQTAASIIVPVSFKASMQQSLSALTVSLATPNRIGDYGAKIMYFSPENRKQILLLNFFSNAMQMVITTIFGMIGLLYAVLKFGIVFSRNKLILFLICFLLFGILAYVFRERQLLLKGLSVARVLNYLQKIERSVKIKIGIYTLIRYSIFSLLFYLLLISFDVEIRFFVALTILFTMYLLASVIPTIFIFDSVVRGGVAVWLFSFVGVSELTIPSTVRSMWALNFAFLAIWGSFYVASFKLKTR